MGKIYTLILVLLAALPVFGQADFQLLAIEPTVSDGGFACNTSAGVTETSPVCADAYSIVGVGAAADPAQFHSAAQKNYVPATNGLLTRITAKYLTAAGTINGWSYEIRIYHTNICDRGTLIATSASVAGNNSWSLTSVDFNFSPSVCLSTATNYNIVVIRSDDGTDATGVNYLNVGYCNSGTISGIVQNYNDAGTPTSASCTTANSKMALNLVY